MSRREKPANPFEESAVVADPKDAAINLLVRAVFRSGLTESGLDAREAAQAIDAAETLTARRLWPERCGACGEPFFECRGH